MSKHTPGPWAISGDETVTVRDTQDGYVALLGWLKGRHIGPCRSAAEVYANARLIAAAPELLEACEGLLGLAERDGWLHVAVNAARAAIAKAKGEQP